MIDKNRRPIMDGINAPLLASAGGGGPNIGSALSGVGPFFIFIFFTPLY